MGGGSDSACHQHPASGRSVIGCPACQTRAFQGNLEAEALHAVAGHGEAVGVEAVGGDDVGAGLDISAVDVVDVGLAGEREEVVVAAEARRPVGEALAAPLALGEAEALYHGAHGAVEDEHSPAQRVAQLGGC